MCLSRALAFCVSPHPHFVCILDQTVSWRDTHRCVCKHACVCNESEGEGGRKNEGDRSASLSAMLQPLGVCKRLLFTCAPAAGAPPSGHKLSHSPSHRERSCVRRGDEAVIERWMKYSSICPGGCHHFSFHLRRKIHELIITGMTAVVSVKHLINPQALYGPASHTDDNISSVQTFDFFTSPSTLGGRMLDKWIVLYSPEFSLTTMASALTTCITYRGERDRQE